MNAWNRFEIKWTLHTVATRADLCRRLGEKAEARAAYQRAMNFAQQEPARRFLEKRLRELAE